MSAHAVAVAADVDDVAVVQYAVDQRGGHDFVARTVPHRQWITRSELTRTVRELLGPVSVSVYSHVRGSSPPWTWIVPPARESRPWTWTDQKDNLPPADQRPARHHQLVRGQRPRNERGRLHGRAGERPAQQTRCRFGRRRGAGLGSGATVSRPQRGLQQQLVNSPRERRSERASRRPLSTASASPALAPRARSRAAFSAFHGRENRLDAPHR